MSDLLQRKLTISDETVESAVGDETVILHLSNGTYYGLDAIGTRIWTEIKRGTPITEVCQMLSREYEVELDVIERDVQELLAEMCSQGILLDE